MRLLYDPAHTQLQRLAAARALCTRPLPSLLVLDEALSSVPEQEEAALHRLLLSVLCSPSPPIQNNRPAASSPSSSSAQSSIPRASSSPADAHDGPHACTKVAQQHQASSSHGATPRRGTGDSGCCRVSAGPQESELPAFPQQAVQGECVGTTPSHAAVVTISHRPSSLVPLHGLLLHMHGDAGGRWELQQSASVQSEMMNIT